MWLKVGPSALNFAPASAVTREPWLRRGVRWAGTPLLPPPSPWCGANPDPTASIGGLISSERLYSGTCLGELTSAAALAAPLSFPAAVGAVGCCRFLEAWLDALRKSRR